MLPLYSRYHILGLATLSGDSYPQDKHQYTTGRSRIISRGLHIIIMSVIIVRGVHISLRLQFRLSFYQFYSIAVQSLSCTWTRIYSQNKPTDLTFSSRVIHKVGAVQLMSFLWHIVYSATRQSSVDPVCAASLSRNQPMSFN